jgi:hypothetical protein
MSDPTPGRGQTVTVYITSAEPLLKRPTLWVYQPGMARWKATTTRTGTYSYRATIKLKAGATGPLALNVWARDAKGRAQSTTVTGFTLH